MPRPFAAMPSDLSAVAPAPRPQLRLVVVGHVDHGKSTLIGRLLYETDNLPAGKVAQLEEIAARRGLGAVEWAFLLDALQAERDQGITIDVSQIWFRTPSRDCVLIDAPGHQEFLKNMVSGAASADAALVVIDAAEGVRAQSRRHGYLLRLLGVRQVVVLINKMDLVGYDAARFNALAAEYRAYLEQIGVMVELFIPIAAREGANIAMLAPQMPWYSGPTVTEAIDRFAPAPAQDDLPLRLPVQDVYKFDHRRILVGRVETGRLAVGDRLVFMPSGKSAMIKSLEAWSQTAPKTASAGWCVGMTLDQELFIERGEVACHAEAPAVAADRLHAHIFWLHAAPLRVGDAVRLKLGTAQVAAVVQTIARVTDATDLAEAPTAAVPRDAVAEVVFALSRPIAADAAPANPRLGRLVVMRAAEVAGGGLVMAVEATPRRATNITPVGHGVTRAMRETRQGHRGGVIWMTGLSGSGKSTLMLEAERQLFARGYQVMSLDGDNLRDGINADLGFTPQDRAENIRRAGAIAALLAQQGVLVLAAFVSPYRADRAVVAAAAGEDFHEVFVDADLATCMRRDPKGLYQKAQAGKIANFTGVSAPYEAPLCPALRLDTTQALDDVVVSLMDYIAKRYPLA